MDKGAARGGEGCVKRAEDLSARYPSAVIPSACCTSGDAELASLCPAIAPRRSCTPRTCTARAATQHIKARSPEHQGAQPSTRTHAPHACNTAYEPVGATPPVGTLLTAWCVPLPSACRLPPHQLTALSIAPATPPAHRLVRTACHPASGHVAHRLVRATLQGRPPCSLRPAACHAPTDHRASHTVCPPLPCLPHCVFPTPTLCAPHSHTVCPPPPCLPHCSSRPHCVPPRPHGMSPTAASRAAQGGRGRESGPGREGGRAAHI